MGGTNLSPITYCSLWEWIEEPMPPSQINPTLGRDAFHPCLISTWPKEWCIIIPDWGKIRSSHNTNCAIISFVVTCIKLLAYKFYI